MKSAKQTTGRRIWFSTKQERTVWYDPINYVFWIQKYNLERKKSEKHIFYSMRGVENFVKVNGYKLLENK